MREHIEFAIIGVILALGAFCTTYIAVRSWQRIEFMRACAEQGERDKCELLFERGEP